MFPAIHKTSSIDWKPSPVLALATSLDATHVAAARADGSLEIWRVSPGSISWHCLLTIHGDPKRRVSSLVWCRAKGLPTGRLLSSSIDGSVSEWDLFHLKQKIVLESNGVSVWQMAVTPSNAVEPLQSKQELKHSHNGYLSDDLESSESEDDDDSVVLNDDSITSTYSIAMARDDGCVQLYCISESNELIYYKSLPRVSGRVLSVAWSPDAKRMYSGSSDGFIRCWDATIGHEIYRITAGLGGLGGASELCIWSLLALSNGTLASADSSGSVQFWDCQHGTLLQAHSLHKGDVYSLAAAPAHNRVFSAGADGQVNLYKLSSERIGSCDNSSSSAVMMKWVYVGYIRAHTHDIRALTVAIPISSEDRLPDKNVKRICGVEKLTDYSYRKWAHLGVPMLISAGDDTKLFAYPVKDFTQFSPHDICPAPQRVPSQLVVSTVLNQYPLLLVQGPFSLDILCLRIRSSAPDMASGVSIGRATTDLLARIKSKSSQKIICSTMSSSGAFFAYSDLSKPNLFELKRSEVGKIAWTVTKQKLPRKLPSAHFMIFSSDSSWLMIAGHDRKIHVVDVKSSNLVHTFTPCRDEKAAKLSPREPPVTKMFTSSNGQWLAAVNCFGDVYIFNLQTQRQHWFISRLDGASVTAGGFHPRDNKMLIIATSFNQVYAFDVDERKLGEWSKQQAFTLPRSFLESYGETIGLSFSPSSSSSSVIIYNARAMCQVDFGMPVSPDISATIVALASQKSQKSSIKGTMKRKLIDHVEESKTKHHVSANSCTFKDPVLFAGHISDTSLLVIDKPWMDVLRSFEDQPIHRHIYGT